MRESTDVVVVGGGPAGLTLANLLVRSGIGCVVLELRSREYVDKRQRAGIVEYRAVHMFEDWGLADRVLGAAPRDGRLEVRFDGEAHVIGDDEYAGAIAGSLCPQQVLVRNLIGALLDDGGDLRFDAADVALRGVDGERPVVSYTDPAGETREIECDFVAGCDGDHGVSRTAVPDGALTRYTMDHGFSWLTVLADARPPRHPLMAVSADGFAAHFPRGPAASRFYLECAVDDRVENWPEERIWASLRARLDDPDLAAGAITELEVFAHRSVVHDPMSYGRLYLLGDAAHIISPMGGKGMNLALHDADVFARAVRDFLRGGDESALRTYSRTCLERVWDCQELSRWMLESTHGAGDRSPEGAFRRELGRARLRRLHSSPTAAHAFVELMAGLAP